MTKTDQFESRVKAIPDAELAEKCDKELSDLCKTCGDSFHMCIPPMVDDTDILFAELIRRFEERDKWISVEDKLPEMMQTVWISNGKGWTTLGGRVITNEGWCWAETNGLIYEHDGKIVSEGGMEDLDVKFWMPLPEPPKKEVEK